MGRGLSMGFTVLMSFSRFDWPGDTETLLLVTLALLAIGTDGFTLSSPLVSFSSTSTFYENVAF